MQEELTQLKVETASLKAEVNAIVREQVAQRSMLSTLNDGQVSMQETVLRQLETNSKLAEQVRDDVTAIVKEGSDMVMSAVTRRLDAQDTSIDAQDQRQQRQAEDIVKLKIKRADADAEQRGRRAILASVYGAVGAALLWAGSIVVDMISGGAG